MRKEKVSVGKCQCPIRDCVEQVPVYKYEGSDDPKKRRFAGRMYAICSVHGRVENQEFILCNAKLKGPENEENDASNASSSSEPNASPPQSGTRPNASPNASENQSTAKPTFWDRFKPVIQL